MQLGDKIPEFSLLDQNGVKRSNKGLKNPLVLFFYPKDDTPGCTIEVCGFRDKYDLFKVLGAQVWGVSNGSTSSHLAFANKNKYNIHYFAILMTLLEKPLEFLKY